MGKTQIHESFKNSEVQNAYSDPDEEKTNVEQVEEVEEETFDAGRSITCAAPMNGDINQKLTGQEKVNEAMPPAILLPVNEEEEHGGAAPQTPTPSTDNDIAMDELDGLLTSINAMTNEKGWTGTFTKEEEETLGSRLNREAVILSDDTLELVWGRQKYRCIAEGGVHYRSSPDLSSDANIVNLKKVECKEIISDMQNWTLIKVDDFWIKITNGAQDYWLPLARQLPTLTDENVYGLYSLTKALSQKLSSCRGKSDSTKTIPVQQLFELVSNVTEKVPEKEDEEKVPEKEDEEKVPENEDGAKPEVREKPSGDKLDLFAERKNMPLWRRMLCCCCCIPCCPWLTGSG